MTCSNARGGRAEDYQVAALWREASASSARSTCSTSGLRGASVLERRSTYPTTRAQCTSRRCLCDGPVSASVHPGSDGHALRPREFATRTTHCESCANCERDPCAAHLEGFSAWGQGDHWILEDPDFASLHGDPRVERVSCTVRCQ